MVDAIRAEQFRVYPITHIDQGLELLTGRPAGNVETPETIHFLVNVQLQRLAQKILAFSATSRDGTQPLDVSVADG